MRIGQAFGIRGQGGKSDSGDGFLTTIDFAQWFALEYVSTWHDFPFTTLHSRSSPDRELAFARMHRRARSLIILFDTICRHRVDDIHCPAALSFPAPRLSQSHSPRSPSSLRRLFIRPDAIIFRLAKYSYFYSDESDGPSDRLTTVL